MTEERLKQLQEYMELVGSVMDGELNRQLQGTCENADEYVARWEYAKKFINAKSFALFAMKSMISSAKEGGVDECTTEPLDVF